MHERGCRTRSRWRIMDCTTTMVSLTTFSSSFRNPLAPMVFSFQCSCGACHVHAITFEIADAFTRSMLSGKIKAGMEVIIASQAMQVN